MLRLHFPAPYASVVAATPVTLASMLATIELFVSLADGVLIHLDLTRTEFFPCHDPVTRFPKTVAEKATRPREELLEDFVIERDLLWEPSPQVMGLDRSPEETDPHDFPLALAIWKLLGRTALSTIREQRPGALAAMAATGPLQAAIATLTPLPEGTDVQLLADELDRRKPHGVAHFGTVILYVAGMTGNQYADTTPLELLDYYGNYGISWNDPANLAVIKEAQEEAIQIANQFHALNTAFMAKPNRLSGVFRTVLRIAAELRRARPAPKTLLEIFAPDSPQVDPLGNTFHPIDISRDVEDLDNLGVQLLGPVFVLSATNPHAFGATGLRDEAGDAPPAPRGGGAAG